MLNLKERGIYKISCKSTNKVYIGSTWQTFFKRFCQHEWELNNNRHKNQYLQNAWNKYGSLNFIFEIIEIIKDKNDLLIREDYWLDYYTSHNKDFGFNINPKATGGIQFTKESLLKRAKTYKKFINEALVYYYDVKSDKISINDVPKKYIKVVQSRLQFVVWNKGKFGHDIDYSYLKGVPKTITKKVIESRKQNQETARNKNVGILIYNCMGELINEFRCPQDIEEYSIKNPNAFPILPSNKGRNNIPIYVLKHQNIINCCRGDSKHYKGLIFRYKNSELPVEPLTLSDFKRNKKVTVEIYCRLKEQSLSENSGKKLEP
jgi:group I intron endonuclease